MQKQASRNYALDFIKVVATTMIVFHHYQFVGNVSFPNYLNFSRNPYFPFERIVELFFMISGFFAYRAGADPSEGRFAPYIGKKMARLLPVMACSNVACCLVSYLYFRMRGSIFGGFELPNFWGLVVSSLGLQKGFGLNPHNVNSPSWFVGALLLMYMMYYIVCYLAKRLRLSVQWLLVFVLFFALGCMELGIAIPFFYGDTFRAYTSFTVGLLLAVFLSKYRVTPMIKALCVGGIAISAAFIFFARKHTDAYRTFVFIICPSLIVLAQTSAASKCFRHPIWHRLSQISYNVYVWHFTLQMFMDLFFYDFMHVPKPSHMYLFTALAWIVGALSHYLLERPLNKWIPRLWRMTIVRKEA